jgi:hypothetical protein
MGVQDRANRIIDAWLTGSSEHLKREMAQVLGAQESGPMSSLKREEQEALQSLVADMWEALVHCKPCSLARFDTTFSLLRHLAQRSVPGVETACAA